MIAEKLKKSILQAAIQGKLTKHEPGDGTAAELLQQIAAEKAKFIKEGKIKKEKPLPEITEDEKPFDLPEGWEWCRLGDIITLKGGKRIPAGRQLTTEKTDHIYIRVTDMQNGTILNNDLHYITDDIYKKISDYIIKTDDLYIVIVGSTIGKTGKVPQQFNNMNLTENAARLIIYLTYKEFILTCLTSEFMQTQFIDKTKQVGQPKLALMRLKTSLLPLPPFHEQQRIVARVEELLAKVDSLSKDEKKLDALQSTMPERLKASLLQAAIQGKLTERLPGDGNAEDLLAEIAAEKQRLIKEKKIKKEKPLPEITEEDKPFDLPEGWAWCRLNDISQYIQRGKSPKYSVVKRYPVIAQKCNQWDGFSIEKAKFIVPETIKSYAKERLLQDEDLMWNSTGLGSVGRMAIYYRRLNPYELAIADSHVTIIRLLKKYVLPRYLYFFIAGPIVQNVIELKTTGSTKQKELQINTIKSYIIPLPPLAEQQRIVRRLEELLPLCEGILQDKPLSVLKDRKKEKENIDSVTVTSDNIKNISSLKKGENSLYKKFDKVKKSTYQVGLLDLVDEFASNPDFKKVFLSGLYVYVDRCLCINHPKYVQYNKQNQAVLTEYANKNKAECCLTFDVTMMMPKDGMTQQTVPITQTSLSSLSGANKEVQANASSLNGTGNEADETERIQRLLKNNFSESLKALMKYKGVTEESLAEALGVSSKTIQRLKKEPEVKRAAITAVCVVMNLNVVVYLDLLNVAGLHPTKSRQDNMIQLILGLRPNLTLAQFNDELEKAGCAALNYGEK